MKIMNNVFIAMTCLVSLTVVLTPGDSVVAGTSSRLAGEWRGCHLASGSGAPWWMRSELKINDDGTFTISEVESDGEVSSADGSLVVSPNGAITMEGNKTALFHLDKHNNVLVGTSTWSSYKKGTCDMSVLLRQAQSYSMADLGGKWEGYSIATGPGEPWWERFKGIIKGDGSFTGTTEESDGTTGTKTGGPGSLGLTSKGEVTLEGEPLGNMAAGKNVWAVTDTWHGYAASTTELKVFLKKARTYSPADMVGTWALYCLSSGRSDQWLRGVVIIKANRSLKGTLRRSNGAKVNFSDTVTVSKNGQVTFSSWPTYKGGLSSGKNFSAGTQTLSNGSSQLHIMVRVN